MGKAAKAAIKVRAQLVELWTRLVEYDKDNKIYNNGHNNLYPNEIERVVGNSPTASRSAIMLGKYISGQGVEGENFVVNKKKNLLITDVIQEMAASIAVQNGVYIHVGYGVGDGGKYIPNKLTVLDYVQCRISKPDDNENPNKIWVANWEHEETERSKISRRINRKDQNDEKEKKWYYPYNPDQDIIEAQIKADSDSGASAEDMIRNYRGQVYYLNLTPHLRYALSKFDGVYNDCDTEYRMSLYANSVTRGGFLGKTAVLTQGLDTETAATVMEDVKKWLGSENSAHIYHLDVEQAENLDNVLKIIQVPTQFDDDMFVNTDKRIRRNISGAANNIPEGLIYSGEGALFSTSGDSYEQMKEFYNEQTREERAIIEQTLKELGFDVKIIPFEAELEVKEGEQDIDTERIKKPDEEIEVKKIEV